MQMSTDSRSGFFGRFKGSSKDNMPEIPSSLPSPPQTQSDEMEGEEMEMMEEVWLSHLASHLLRQLIILRSAPHSMDGVPPT